MKGHRAARRGSRGARNVRATAAAVGDQGGKGRRGIDLQAFVNNVSCLFACLVFLRRCVSFWDLHDLKYYPIGHDV